MNGFSGWLSVAVGVGVVAAAALLAAPTGAQAADGDAVIQGAWNTSSLGTVMQHTDFSRSPWTLSVDGGLNADFLNVEGDGENSTRDTMTVNSDGPGRALNLFSGNSSATLLSTNIKDGPAIYGTSRGETSTAILGLGGSKGRGARLRGGAAQLQLEPGTASSHPSSGQLGDLYLDKSGRLWFCKGGTTWKQLA